MNPVKRLISAVTERAMARRARLPRWVVYLMEGVAKRPGAMPSRIIGLLLGGNRSSLRPAPTEVPNTRRRVYVSPTNYSGQGWLWARALERADVGLGASNLAVQLPGGFGFVADRSVPLQVQNLSRTWQEDEFDAVRQFSHVLVEAERSLFGGLMGWDVARETRELSRAGVDVAFMCHGTDIRSPRRHLALTEWSPFAENPRETAAMQADADRNEALLQELGRPVFVSTPDLLLDVPGAAWCPVVIDPDRWVATKPVLRRDRPVVLHVPSSVAMKGTALIAPAMQRLHDEGVIEYRLVSGVAAAGMPAQIADADIVLDQFRLGSYGVAACEAMAAGRIVVGHVLPQVREAVRVASGRELPIVEATPASLERVILDLITEREVGAALGETCVAFVRAVHNGEMSAQVLLAGWIEKAHT